MSPRSSKVASPTDSEDKRQQYVAAASASLLELITSEQAVTWLEVEAKLAEPNWIGYEKAHMPHSLTAAKQELIRANKIREIPSNDAVTVLTTPQLSPRNPAIGRKRALNRRYLSWANQRRMIGPAGERAVTLSLIASGSMQLPTQGGEISEVLGYKFDGPLDSGGFLPILSEDEPGKSQVIFCPIEVKNIREWIYPHSDRLYQVLDKAAGLQIRHPTLPIHPVLICRRVHYTTYFMAKQLGFKVFELERQYIDPRAVADEATAEHMREIRDELGMIDLIPISDEIRNGGDPKLRKWFAQSLPKYALEASEAWRRTVLDEGFHEHFGPMRHTTSERKRTQILNELRRQVVDAGLQGGF